MSMIVKKLIAELEKIENKYLEVQIYDIGSPRAIKEIDSVRKGDKKVLLITEVKLFK